MAHQTSKILREHSTPSSIGRLMDAAFFRGACLLFSLHMSRELEQMLVSQTDIRVTDHRNILQQLRAASSCSELSF